MAERKFLLQELWGLRALVLATVFLVLIRLEAIAKKQQNMVVGQDM